MPDVIDYKVSMGLSVDALLAELEMAFPLRAPHPGDTIESLQRMGGQREVIEYIHSRLEQDE